MEKEDYFSDDCIVKNELYNSLKSLLTCPLCNNIYKDPLICSNCQSVYCQKCLDNYSKKRDCPNCKNNKFSKSILKNELLSKIKYKCKNCKEEVENDNIKAHLESNCEKKEDKEKTLAEEYKTKKALIKLSPKEMAKIDKKTVNHFTSKLFNNIIKISIVITLGLTGVGKSSLIYR